MKYPETAKRLSVALDRIHISQQELSDLSGVSKFSISQYINGSHCPSNISSGKMAKVLKVNPVWLMGFDVPMNVSEALSETSPKAVVDFMINANSRKLLEMYARLSVESQKSLMDLAEFLYNKEKDVD